MCPAIAGSSLDQAVDIYIVTDTDVMSDGLIADYRLLMSDEEKARSDRFHFERDRRQFIIARALIRTTLSRYLPAVNPSAWVFGTGTSGRPFIAGNDQLHFNLSHTLGVIALAVANRPLIGVDVENHDRAISAEEIAARYFGRGEYEALMALPIAARREAFFDLWTLKEAYVKAGGDGLAIPFTDVCFEFHGDTGVTLNFASGHRDDPGRWQFWCMRPIPCVTLSLAIGDHQDGVALRLFRGVPTIGFEDIQTELRHAYPSPA